MSSELQLRDIVFLDIDSHGSRETQLSMGVAECPAETRQKGCKYLLVPSCKASRPTMLIIIVDIGQFTVSFLAS